MEALSYWASWASIAGLIAAFWAGLKARGAQVAAKEARAAIATRMTSQALMRIRFDIASIADSVDSKQWQLAARLADRVTDELTPMSHPKATGVSRDFGEMLAMAREAIQKVSSRARQHVREDTEVPPEDLEALANRTADARTWLGQAAGMLRDVEERRLS